jgi:hypothetical protein
MTAPSLRGAHAAPIISEGDIVPSAWSGTFSASFGPICSSAFDTERFIELRGLIDRHWRETPDVVV